MDYLVTDTELINVADAIRAKGGTSALLEWDSGYVSAINAIQTGGSLTITVYTIANANITATKGETTLTGTADASGVCVIPVTEEGFYTVSAYNGETLLGTKTVNAHYNFSTIIGLDPVDLTFGGVSDAMFTTIITGAHEGPIDLQNDLGWAVGDTRTIHINSWRDATNQLHSAQDATIAISSFANYENCGNVMQFDFLSLISSIRWNSSSWNAYGGSKLKQSHDLLVGALPQYIQDLLLPFDVKVSVGGGASSSASEITTVSNNKLASRSEVEIFGSVTESYAGEGTQVELYKTPSYIIKPSGDGRDWWERSPSNYSYGSSCRVYRNGTPARDAVDSYNGIAPFGCL